MGFPLNDWPCFPVLTGLQLQVAPGFVWFPLMVMSSLCSWFVWLRNYSQFREALLLHELLFLSPINF